MDDSDPTQIPHERIASSPMLHPGNPGAQGRFAAMELRKNKRLRPGLNLLFDPELGAGMIVPSGPLEKLEAAWLMRGALAGH